MTIKEPVKTIDVIGYLATNPIIQIVSSNKSIAHFFITHNSIDTLENKPDEPISFWQRALFEYLPDSLGIAGKNLKLKQGTKVCLACELSYLSRHDRQAKRYIDTYLKIKDIEILHSY